MNKKIMSLGVGILLLGLAGCQGNNNQPKPKAEQAPQQTQITLSKEEKDLAKGDANIGAQLLVRKAVLADMKTAALDEKEKFEMQYVRDEAAIAYFISKIAGEKIDIPEEEIKKVYELNKEQLGEKKLKDVHDDIKAALINNVQSTRVVNYYKELVEKYKLNDALKAEFPEPAPEAKPEVKQEDKQ